MGRKRDVWSSRTGFVLAAAGSTMGLGAIWKFPYMAGAGGGGAFLIVYLAALVVIGLTMMLAELSIGRSVQTDAVGAFRRLGGKKWRVFGYLSLLTAFILLSFYCVIGGWIVGYLVKALTGFLFAANDPETLAAHFDDFIGDPVATLILFATFMGLTVAIILGGVRSGIERAARVLMPLLFLLMITMVVRSLTLPGAIEGARFLLIPDLSKITPRILIDALGLACFSLSVGFAGMLTYGSYMRRGENLVRSALWVIVLQTICMMMAGFVLLPAVYALGLRSAAGPTLTYITLPAIFGAMPGGGFFATVFFALFLMAALTSSISIIEPIVTHLIDRYHLSRVVACCSVALASFVAGIPASWSFGLAKGWTLFDKSPFELMDCLTLNILVPVNVLAVCLLMGWVANPVFLEELYRRRYRARGLMGRMPVWVLPINFSCRFVAPIAIVTILLVNFWQ